MQEKESEIIGYALELIEGTNMVGIYNVLSCGENPPLIETAKEPFVTFPYGVYTKKELQELTNGLFEEYFELDKSIDFRKKEIQRFRGILERERDKLKRWSIIN